MFSFFDIFEWFYIIENDLSIMSVGFVARNPSLMDSKEQYLNFALKWC